MKKIILAALALMVLSIGAITYVAIRYAHEKDGSRTNSQAMPMANLPLSGGDLSSFAATAPAPATQSGNDQNNSPIFATQPAANGQTLTGPSVGQVQSAPSLAPPSKVTVSPPPASGETPGSNCQPRPGYACPLDDTTR